MPLFLVLLEIPCGDVRVDRGARRHHALVEKDVRAVQGDAFAGLRTRAEVQIDARYELRHGGEVFGAGEIPQLVHVLPAQQLRGVARNAGAHIGMVVKRRHAVNVLDLSPSAESGRYALRDLLDALLEEGPPFGAGGPYGSPPAGIRD